MKTSLLSGALIGILAVALPLQSQAAKKKTAADTSASPSPAPVAEASATPVASPAPEAKKSERPIPFYGKIAVVNASTKEFTLATKTGTGRVLKVTEKTVLTKAGNPATFADVVKDEDVRGSYWKLPNGSLEAKSVKLGPLTEAEKAAKAAKGAKAKATP